MLFTIVALAAACTGDTGTTTTAGEATGGSTDQTTAPDLSGYMPSDDLACVYLQDVLAVAIENPEDPASRQDTIDGATSALEGLGITGHEAFAAAVLGESDPENPDAISALPFDPEDAAEFESAHSAIDRALALIVIDADPMLTARALRSETRLGIRAAAVHAVGSVGHYKLAPGTNASSFTATLSSVDAVPDDPEFGYVAVVDSGVAEGAESPSWLFGPDNLEFSASDVESTATGPSHGTFVAGLIRQVAPTHAVSLASARAVDQTDLATFPFGDTIETPLTTELHVFEALERLIYRHGSLDGPVDALNLSLGAYSCDQLDDGTLSLAEDDTVLTLSTALQAWRGSKILAAAGNENYQYNGLYVKFWPGALTDVAAIAASSLAHNEVVWERDPVTGDREVAVASGARPWVLASAPGVDLLSIGDGAGGVYSWGGSSFATAVASGMTVSGISPGTGYNGAPGLSYVASGVKVTNPRPTSPTTTTP